LAGLSASEGAKRWQTLSQLGWANGGSRGAKPPGRGLWGMCPHKFQKGGEQLTLVTKQRVGPRTLANPQPTGVGNGGGGDTAPSQGVWEMCPQNKTRGQFAHLSNPARSEAQNAGEPKAHEGGQTGGPGGTSPLAGGCGGCAPTKPKEGARSQH